MSSGTSGSSSSSGGSSSSSGSGALLPLLRPGGARPAGLRHGLAWRALVRAHYALITSSYTTFRV